MIIVQASLLRGHADKQSHVEESVSVAIGEKNSTSGIMLGLEPSF